MCKFDEKYRYCADFDYTLAASNFFRTIDKYASTIIKKLILVYK